MVVPQGAPAHPERATVFPNWTGPKVPKYRTKGPALVVCQKNSKALVKRIFKGRGKKTRRERKRRMKLLKKCKFDHVQDAVNAARSGYRILIMPGVYREPKAREVPAGTYQQEPCPNDYVETEGFSDAPPPAGPTSNDPPVRPDRNFHIKCPNAKNLIAVIGDTRPEENTQKPSELPKCIQKCNLQIEGMGRVPADVLLEGDRKKMDVLRIDRADGIYLRRFAIEQGAFNGIDVVETNGFTVKQIEARYNQNYGVLSFASTNGLYDRIVAHGNGDAGVYPGSNQKGCDVDHNVYETCEPKGCQHFTTELRHIDSFNNVQGYSGTAGNSTYIHDSRFHGNSIGLSSDSFASGHPGMPQECVRWERNEIYSNNINWFTAENQDKCNSKPFAERPREWVCPQFQVPVGSGIVLAGANRNLVQNNRIYDNWRQGVQLFAVPASLRDEPEPDRQTDTSNGNRFLANIMGTAPDGRADPNGVDFWWDEQGRGNCWEGNASKSGSARASDPSSLPNCGAPSNSDQPNPLKSSQLVPCSAWDPAENPRPIACDWFDLPPEPQP